MKFEAIAKSFSKKELPQSEVEFVGEVPADVIGQYKETALGSIAAEMVLPGFRKGHVPVDMALKQVGEVGALEEAVELFVRDFYPELVEVTELDVVGRPHISITKLAPGNPIGLSIRVAIYPEVTLPKDWKKVAEKVPLEKAAEASDEEVSQTIESLRKSRAEQKAADSEPILDAEGKPIPPPLPDVTDEWAKSLGAFENVDALKAQIKKGIGEEKERTARDARRGKIIDSLLEKTSVAIPTVFVESELDKIISQMREDVARFGMSMEEYLKRVEKTEEQIRADFTEQATKRAKLQLTLNKIASEEKIESDPEAVESEMKHAIEHFPEANKALLRVHIESVLRNEKVLKMLEGSEEKK